MNRLVHIISGLSSGGAENALYKSLANGLVNSYDNFVISLKGEGFYGEKIRNLGVPVYTLEMSWWKIGNAGVKLRGLMREISPDLIQGWMYHGNIMAFLGRYFAPGSPILVWNIRHSLHQLANEKISTRVVIRLNKILSNKTNCILYNSYISSYQHNNIGVRGPQSNVIPNGFDVSKYHFCSLSHRSLRRQLGISSSDFVVGHVARCHPIKNHKGFLRSAARTAEKFSRVHFVLIGRNVTYKNECLRNMIPSELSDQFHLLGERQDVPSLMSTMDILVSSSLGEGFPNTVGEAMATGVPCIVTDVGDCAFLVGNHGMAVPASDEEKLQEAIEHMVKLPSSQIKLLGEEAQKKIKHKYRIEAIVQEYINLYESLLDNLEN